MNEFTFQSLSSAQSFLATSIEKELQFQIAKNGHALLILPGGNSIKPFYKDLAEMNVDWRYVWISLSDERLVSTDNNLSNQKQLSEMFLSKIKYAQFLPLNDQLALKLEQYPPVTILSMGEDGHVASLFPEEAEYWLKNHESKFYTTILQIVKRTSLSKNSLIKSLCLYTLVCGDKKLEVFDSLRMKPGVYDFLFIKSNFIICPQKFY